MYVCISQHIKRYKKSLIKSLFNIVITPICPIILQLRFTTSSVITFS